MPRPPELLAIEYRSRDFSSPDAFQRRLQALLDALDGRSDSPSVSLTGLLLPEPQLFRPGHDRQFLLGLRTGEEAYLAVFADVCSAYGIPGLLGWEGPVLPGSPEIWQGFGLFIAHGANEPLIGATAAQIRTAFQPLHGTKFAMPGLQKDSAMLDGLIETEARRQGIKLLWGPGHGINHPDSAGTILLSARQDHEAIPLDLLLRWMDGDRLARSRARLQEIGELARHFFFARSSSRD